MGIVPQKIAFGITEKRDENDKIMTKNAVGFCGIIFCISFKPMRSNYTRNKINRV